MSSLRRLDIRFTTSGSRGSFFSRLHNLHNFLFHDVTTSYFPISLCHLFIMSYLIMSLLHNPPFQCLFFVPSHYLIASYFSISRSHCITVLQYFLLPKLKIKRVISLEHLPDKIKIKVVIAEKEEGETGGEDSIKGTIWGRDWKLCQGSQCQLLPLVSWK